MTNQGIIAQPSGGGSIIVKDDGSVLTANATSINFAGAGVTASTSGGDVTATITGGGGGGSSYVEVANFAALPAASGVAGEIYAVLAGQGVYFVNRKPAGFYRSDGADWTYLADLGDPYFSDSVLVISDDADVTKKAQFQLSGITTGTTRTLTVPNASGTIMLVGGAPTAHAASHTNGADDIQSATSSQKGLATAAQIAKLDGIEALADVTDAGNVGSSVHGTTGKATPVDADTLPLIDSAASNVLKKVTWANLKATLKAYFDTLYPSGSGTCIGTNTGDNAVNSLYSGLVSNATHTGDATGSTALTLATVNSNVGSFGSATQSLTATVNAKGLVTAISAQTVTPAVGSVTGLGTGVATALAVNIGSSGAPVVNAGALGTPSSGTLTNCTGLPLSSGVVGDLPFANLTAATAASKLLGRGDSGAGDFQEITLGTGLSMSGTTLNATGGGGGSGDFLSALVSSEISITGTATATISRIHVCSGTTSDYTVTLPTASGNAGKFIAFRMASGLTKLVTIDGSGSETIDGQLTRVMWAKETATLMSDGTNWVKISGQSRAMNCSMRRSSNQSLSATTDILVQLDQTDIDNTGLMGSTSNNRIIIARAGTYVCTGQTFFNALTANNDILGSKVYKNGAGLYDTNASGLSGAFPSVPITPKPLALAASDYIQLYVFTRLAETIYGTGSGPCAFLTVTETDLW